MQKQITIEYLSGEKAVYTALTSDYARWEKETGKVATEFASLWDMYFLSYQAYKRANAGKLVKDFDAWMDTVADISAGGEDPKATNAEVSTDSSLN